MTTNLAASVNQGLRGGNPSECASMCVCVGVAGVCTRHVLGPAVSAREIIHILDRRKLHSSRTLQKVITN